MDNLIFCNVDEYGFPHWNGMDFLRWMILPTDWDFVTGEAYLWLYKTAWLVHHRNLIKQYAHEAQVPVLLLAGVAVSEVGGMPDRAKSIGVLQAKQVIDEIRGEKNKYSNKTSVGSIAIQPGVAAKTLGIDPTTLDHFQQFRAKISRREHVAHANHIFVAGHGDFARNMGRSDDDIRTAQLAFVFANRAAVYRVVDVRLG